MPTIKIYSQAAENITATHPPHDSSQLKLAGFSKHNSQCWIHNTFGVSALRSPFYPITNPPNPSNFTKLVGLNI